MPTILLGTLILVLSVCVCVHIHKGNRELHRELRKEYKKNQESEGKYETQSSPPESPVMSPDIIIDSDDHVINNYESSSDSDDDVLRKKPPEDLDAIEKADEMPNQYLKKNGHRMERTPSPTPSSLSVRSIESRKHSGLHPLNGLIQPTGLVPQAGGYQANMRLLFKQRPSSAVSLAPDATSNHFDFMMKSRPASAISRISSAPRPTATTTTRKRLSATSSETDTETETETEFSNSQIMEGLRPAYRNEVSVTESMKRFSKNIPVKKLSNGHVQNGSVKNGILKNRKPSDADSDSAASVSHKSSVSSNSSVRFTIETPDVRKLQKQTSTSSSSSSVNSIVASKRILRRQASTTSVGSTASRVSSSETVMERVLRERSAKNITSRKVETPKPPKPAPTKSILKPSSTERKERQKKRSIIFASPSKEKKTLQNKQVTKKSKVNLRF